MKIFCNEKLLINQVTVADTFITKLKGLLGKNHIDEDEALLLKNCSSIHCLFMKITIDAVYLSRNMTVIYKETIKPWHVGKIVKKTCHVLELKEGKSAEVKIGDILYLK